MTEYTRENMPDDLRWIAEHVSEWPENYLSVDLVINDSIRPYGKCCIYFEGRLEGEYAKPEWQAARQALGLDQSEVSEEDVQPIKWSIWYPHYPEQGGQRPDFIPDNRIVQVKLKDGEVLEDKDDAGKGYCWGPDGSRLGREIVEFRYALPDSWICTPEEDEEWQRKAEQQPAWAGSVPEGVETHDSVNKPKHYQLREGYEVYDLRQDLAAKAEMLSVPHSEFSDWDRALEYLIRMWDKNMLEDAKKSRWYINKLIEKLEERELNE